MSDHIGEPNGMTCHHCGLPADRNQNGIQGYRCGSSYCEAFRPQWARSMTCLEVENKRLRERISVMDDEALLSSDVFETDRSIKWDLSQQIEKLKRELNAANERIKRLEKNIESLKVWGNELDCEVYAPDPNCSCHISPPCNDCLEYSNIREIKAGWKAAKEAKP